MFMLGYKYKKTPSPYIFFVVVEKLRFAGRKLSTGILSNQYVIFKSLSVQLFFQEFIFNNQIPKLDESCKRTQIASVEK